MRRSDEDETKWNDWRKMYRFFDQFWTFSPKIIRFQKKKTSKTGVRVPPAPCSAPAPPPCPGELGSDQSETAAAPCELPLWPRVRLTGQPADSGRHGRLHHRKTSRSSRSESHLEAGRVTGRADGVAGQLRSVCVWTLVEDQLTRPVLTETLKLNISQLWARLHFHSTLTNVLLVPWSLAASAVLGCRWRRCRAAW